MKYTEDEIEQMLDKVNGLLANFEKADADFKDRQDRKHWDETYGERLGQYSDKMKQLNGDDFDIIDEARKEHSDSYSDLSEDDYVNALEENIKKVFERVWPSEVAQAAAEKVAEEIDNTAESESEITSDSRAKERYRKRSEANKKKLEGWDPQKRLGSDEDIKQETDPVKADYEELLAIKEKMPTRKRGE